MTISDKMHATVVAVIGAGFTIATAAGLISGTEAATISAALLTIFNTVTTQLAKNSPGTGQAAK